MSSYKSEEGLLNFAVLALREGNKSLEGIDWSEPMTKNNELAMKYAVMGLKNHVSCLVKTPSSKIVGYSWLKHTELRRRLLPMTKPCQRNISSTTSGIGKYAPIFSLPESKPQVIPFCYKKTLPKQHSGPNKTKRCQDFAAKNKLKNSIGCLRKSLKHHDTSISNGLSTERNCNVKSMNATRKSRDPEKRSVFWNNQEPYEFNQLDILKSMYAVLSALGGSTSLADSDLWSQLADKLGYRNFIDVRKYFLKYVYPNLEDILEGNDEIHSKARNMIKAWCNNKYNNSSSY